MLPLSEVVSKVRETIPMFDHVSQEELVRTLIGELETRFLLLSERRMTYTHKGKRSSGAKAWEQMGTQLREEAARLRVAVALQTNQCKIATNKKKRRFKELGEGDLSLEPTVQQERCQELVASRERFCSSPPPRSLPLHLAAALGDIQAITHLMSSGFPRDGTPSTVAVGTPAVLAVHTRREIRRASPVGGGSYQWCVRWYLPRSGIGAVLRVLGCSCCCTARVLLLHVAVVLRSIRQYVI